MEQVEWLSLLQAAAAVGVPRTTMQNWALKGKVRAHKMPGRTGAYLISRDEVDRLVSEQETTQRSQAGVSA